MLDANPYTTLQVVLEPAATEVAERLPPRLLEALLAACQERPTYLDKFYALQPGPVNGAKRLVVVLPLALRPALAGEWTEDGGEYATLVWRGALAESEEDMEAHEYAWIS